MLYFQNEILLVLLEFRESETQGREKTKAQNGRTTTQIGVSANSGDLKGRVFKI